MHLPLLSSPLIHVVSWYNVFLVSPPFVVDADLLWYKVQSSKKTTTLMQAVALSLGTTLRPFNTIKLAVSQGPLVQSDDITSI